MRRTLRLALGILLCSGLLAPALAPAFAVEPDDLPWDEIDRVLKEVPQPAPEDTTEPETAVTSPETAPKEPSATTGPLPATGEPKPADIAAPSPASPANPTARLEPAQAAPASPSTPVATPAAAPPAAPSPVKTAIQSPAPTEATPPAATPPAPPALAATTAPVATSAKIFLPMKRYFETKAAVTLKEYEEPDRTALLAYYEAQMGEALWVTREGFNAAALNLIAEIAKADDWGLSSADYKTPGLAKIGSGEFLEDDLIEAEINLSLTALHYARHARGFRIYDPTVQLSSYLDRKPQLLEPAKIIDGLVAAPDKGAFLRTLHPKHAQFAKLREKLLELRANAGKDEFDNIANGPKITPGKSHWQVALVRRALKVASPGMKPDGTAADDTYYDTALARAVEQYKESNELTPVNGTITNELRKALNADYSVSEELLLANMEQWRWMPEELGKLHIAVNIPEFTVRVLKEDAIIHSERIVTGKFETQTPIFSDEMRTVVFQPSWNVPESIKINELLPKLRAGGNPIGGQGLAIKRNGRNIGVWDIDWETADIRHYHIYQPPGDANVLGIVKFLFPNKHAVYLHDTPSKSLFNQKVRTFSHGCMRVRNPVQLAEVLMAEDKGWDKSQVNEMITTGPEDNDIALDHPIPVHVTYFTAWVDDSGKLKTFADIYGHQKRIILGLEGRWGEIVKNRDHLEPADPDNVPVARNPDDWGDNGARPGRRYRQQPRLTYREPPNYKQQKSVGDLLQSVFGGF